MKILKTIIRITLATALFTIVPLVVFTLITSKTSVVQSIQSFVVLSGSMTPTIPVGSVSYTKKGNIYNKGDIIAFKSGDVTVTHRIVKVLHTNGEISYRTKGDANNTIDSKAVAVSDVLGKQFVFVPYIGRAIIFLKTPVGFFYIILFPMIVFVIMEIWNLKKEIEKHAEQKYKKKMEMLENLTI